MLTYSLFSRIQRNFAKEIEYSAVKFLSIYN